MSGKDVTPLSITRTTTELLQGLKHSDNHGTWQEFVSRYMPVIVGYGKRFGLSDADALDVAQETLVNFSTAYQEGKYDRSRGRLRKWLAGIAHRQIQNFVRKRGRDRLAPVEFVQDVLEVDDPLEEFWEEEWRKSVYLICMSELQKTLSPDHFEAYRAYALEGEPANEVADRLGITPQAIYLIKHRTNNRLMEMRQLFED